jgi:hypothetical protein
VLVELELDCRIIPKCLSDPTRQGVIGGDECLDVSVAKTETCKGNECFV